MKRIAFVFHDTFYNSGATRSMIDVIDQLLQKKEYKIYAVFPNFQGTAIEYLKEKKVNIYCVRYDYVITSLDKKNIKKRGIEFLLYLRSFFHTLFLIGPWMRKKHIQLVYTNTSVVYVGAWIKKYFGIKHIWHFREFVQEDFNCGRYMGDDNFYRLANKYSDFVVVISNALRNKYERRIKGKRIVRIYDDLSKRYINPKKKSKNNRNEYVIITVGRFCAGKNQLEVVKAVEILIRNGYEIKLYLVGNDNNDYARRLKEYVARHGLASNVFFTGELDDLNIIRSEGDIGIVASTSEAFGRVTLEGMLSEMVMIGADRAGTTELIQDGKTGFLYENGNVEQLALLIRRVVEEKQLSRQIAKNGFEYAKRYTVGNAARKISKLIDLIVE